METLGSFIRKARERKKIHSRVLAARLGVSPSYVSDIELDRRVPAEAVLHALAFHLDVLYSDVLAYAGKLDAETRRYLLAHPMAMKLLRRIAYADLDDAALERLLESVDEAGKSSA